MTRYIALDVHTESTTCVVVSPTAKRLKQEVVETSGSALIEFLKGLSGRKHLVLEEGTRSAWLHETLSPHVDELVVAIAESARGNKSDARDAWQLAEQLRMGAIGRTVFKRPGSLRGCALPSDGSSPLRGGFRPELQRGITLHRRCL